MYKKQSSYKTEIKTFLEEVIEYFEQYADAEFFTDRAQGVGNEEMRLMVNAQDALDSLRYLYESKAPL